MSQTRASADVKAAYGAVNYWITNIASHVERERSGDRYELCVSKEHEHLFRGDGQLVELRVGDTVWRGTVGIKAGVGHIYFHTRLTTEDGNTSTITKVLQRAGLRVGQRGSLLIEGPYRFSL